MLRWASVLAVALTIWLAPAALARPAWAAAPHVLPAAAAAAPLEIPEPVTIILFATGLAVMAAAATVKRKR